MSIEQIVTLLVAERDRINRAIEALGGGATAKRRGRPPKAQTAGGTEAGNPHIAKRMGRPPMSADEKLAASKRMKAFWAAKRKAKK